MSSHHSNGGTTDGTTRNVRHCDAMVDGKGKSMSWKRTRERVLKLKRLKRIFPTIEMRQQSAEQAGHWGFRDSRWIKDKIRKGAYR